MGQQNPVFFRFLVVLACLLFAASAATAAAVAATEPIAYLPDISGVTDVDYSMQSQCTTTCSMKSKNRRTTCETMCVQVPTEEAGAQDDAIS